MTFASFEFLAFFLVVLVGHSLCGTRTSRNWLLLVASYAFYLSWSVASGLLIFTVSAVDYYVGRKLAGTEAPGLRSRWLAVSVVTNLGLLGFFKYSNFLLANAGWPFRLLGFDTTAWRFDIILPVGISFFIFKSMSHTLDVYRRTIQPCSSFRDYLLFVSFFPQLLAGPIARAAELLPQLARSVRATVADIEVGLVQFGLGAVKKLAIADQVAGHVDLIFANPGQYDAMTLLQARSGIPFRFTATSPATRTWPSGRPACSATEPRKTSRCRTAQETSPTSGVVGTFPCRPGSGIISFCRWPMRSLVGCLKNATEASVWMWQSTLRRSW